MKLILLILTLFVFFGVNAQSGKINGKILAKYDQVYPPEKNGNCIVRKNSKQGMIDSSGKEIVGLIYDDIYGFSEGLSRVKLNEKYGFIDLNGKLVIPVIYTKAFAVFSNYKCEVSLDGHSFYIDTTGKCIENCSSKDVASKETKNAIPEDAQKIGESTAYIIFPYKQNFSKENSETSAEYTATYNDNSGVKMAWIYTDNRKNEDKNVGKLYASLKMSNLAKSLSAEVVEEKSKDNAVNNGESCYSISQIWKVGSTYYKAVSFITEKGRVLLIADNNKNDFTDPVYLVFFGGFHFK